MGCRLDVPDGRGHIMQGVLGDLLSDDLASWRNPDEHRPDALVQKPAERLHRLLQFAGCALELGRIRLPG
jgi:hypothetical protein